MDISNITRTSTFSLFPFPLSDPSHSTSDIPNIDKNEKKPSKQVKYKFREHIKVSRFSCFSHILILIPCRKKDGETHSPLWASSVERERGVLESEEIFTAHLASGNICFNNHELSSRCLYGYVLRFRFHSIEKQREREADFDMNGEKIK